MNSASWSVRDHENCIVVVGYYGYCWFLVEIFIPYTSVVWLAGMRVEGGYPKKWGNYRRNAKGGWSIKKGGVFKGGRFVYWVDGRRLEGDGVDLRRMRRMRSTNHTKAVCSYAAATAASGEHGACKDKEAAEDGNRHDGELSDHMGSTGLPRNY